MTVRIECDGCGILDKYSERETLTGETVYCTRCDQQIELTPDNKADALDALFDRLEHVESLLMIEV